MGPSRSGAALSPSGRRLQGRSWDRYECATSGIHAFSLRRCRTDRIRSADLAAPTLRAVELIADCPNQGAQQIIEGEDADWPLLRNADDGHMVALHSRNSEQGGWRQIGCDQQGRLYRVVEVKGLGERAPIVFCHGRVQQRRPKSQFDFFDAIALLGVCGDVEVELTQQQDALLFNPQISGNMHQ